MNNECQDIVRFFSGNHILRLLNGLNTLLLTRRHYISREILSHCVSQIQGITHNWYFIRFCRGKGMRFIAKMSHDWMDLKQRPTWPWEHLSCSRRLDLPAAGLPGYIGPTWGRQDPGGPHVGSMSLAIRGGSLDRHDSKSGILGSHVVFLFWCLFISYLVQFTWGFSLTNYFKLQRCSFKCQCLVSMIYY